MSIEHELEEIGRMAGGDGRAILRTGYLDGVGPRSGGIMAAEIWLSLPNGQSNTFTDATIEMVLAKARHRFGMGRPAELESVGA